jgi:hypothetical protein
MDLTKDSVGGKLQWPRGVTIPCVAELEMPIVTIDLYTQVILDLWGSPQGSLEGRSPREVHRMLRVHQHATAGSMSQSIPLTLKVQ